MSKKILLDIPASCSLSECRDFARKYGYNSVTFDAYFPAGKRKCKWVDAVEGWFEVEGVTNPGFFFEVVKVQKMFPDLECLNLQIEPKGGTQ